MAQTLLDTDSLTNTAATPLPTHSANWVTTDLVDWTSLVIADSGVGISSAATSLWASNYRTGQTWTNDQWAEFKIGSLPGSSIALVGVRLQTDDTISGYFAGYSTFDDATHYLLFKDTNATRVVLATSATTYATGDVVNLQISGTTLTVMVNTIVLSDLTTIDATYATGNPGMLIYHSNTTISYANSWRAGSVTASAPAASPLFRGS